VKKHEDEDSNVFILKGLRREVDNSFLGRSDRALVLPGNSFSRIDMTGDITGIHQQTRRTQANQSQAENSLFNDLFNGLSK